MKFSFLRHNQPAVNGRREDGYISGQAAVVLKFQSIVEYEPDVDYPALAAALFWARTDGMNKAVTLMNLRAVYNDARYSSASYAYGRGR